MKKLFVETFGWPLFWNTRILIGLADVGRRVADGVGVIHNLLFGKQYQLH